MASMQNTVKRIVDFPLVRMVLAISTVIGAILLHNVVYDLVLKDLDGENARFWKDIEVLINIAVIAGLYALYVRWVEKRRPEELSETGSIKEFASGFGTGGGLVLISVIAIIVVADFDIAKVNAPQVLIHKLVLIMLLAFMEDLVFRAIIFRISEEVIGTVWAVVLVAGLFGLIHLGNENATLLSSFSIGLADLLLAGAFILTRRLWLVWGIHVGWNFMQTGVFGMPSSGNPPEDTWLVPSIDGPIWLTGGEFGIELSLIGIGSNLLVGLFLLKRAYDKGMFVAPSWKKTNQ